MSTILDVIVVAIFALSIFLGAKNGFVKSLVNISSVLVAIIVTAIFANSLQAKLIESSPAQHVRDAISERCSEMVASKEDSYDPEEVKSTSAFSSMLEIIGIDSDELESNWQEWKKGNEETLKEKMVDYVASPLVNAITLLLSFIILFFGTIIVLKLTAFILDKIFLLPVLKQANSLLGIVLGAVMGVICIFAFCYIVNLLLPYLQANNVALVSKIDPESTFIYKWFAHIDLLSLII